MKKVIFFSCFVFVFIISGYVFWQIDGRDINNFSENSVAEDISYDELLDRVGQMIIVGFRGMEINEELQNMIKEVRPGGVILMDYDIPSGISSRNILNADQVSLLIEDMQSVSDTPLFISVDAEGGFVNRLKPDYGFIFVPSAKDMGYGVLSNTREIASNLAIQLLNLGFNMNFAPVVDVDVNPNSPAIGALERSFSDDPHIVVDHARVFSLSHRERGVIPVLKHFPGHGSSDYDSHFGVADVTDTYNEKEKVPYEVLIGEGEVDAVMTAHIMHRGVDSKYPTTLSRVFLEDGLRGQLGFDGVIISDDMQMKAIVDQFGLSRAVKLAVLAGVDVVLSANNGEYYDSSVALSMRDAILEGVYNGKIPISRIVESSDRVYSLKRKYGIIK